MDEKSRLRYLGDGTLPDERVDALNRALRQRYNTSGRGWITLTVLRGRPALRVTIMNPRTSEEHLSRMLDDLESLGRELTS
jgi:L-2,4-diaminobutyrate decarboxylase